MSEKWSIRKLERLLEGYSRNQENFKTKPSGRGMAGPHGGKCYVKGYFTIDVKDDGSYRLLYAIPYSEGGVRPVTHSFPTPRKLADFLQALGPTGLKAWFKELERETKPRMKRQFEREKAEMANKKSLSPTKRRR